MMTKSLTAAAAFFCSASLAMAALPTDAAPTTPTQAAAFESLDVAGTNGMDRRQDRRDTRQDCRGDNGAVGKDKRDCKQSSRG